MSRLRCRSSLQPLPPGPITRVQFRLSSIGVPGIAISKICKSSNERLCPAIVLLAKPFVQPRRCLRIPIPPIKPGAAFECAKKIISGLGRRKEEEHAGRLSREHLKRTVPGRRHVPDGRRRRTGLDASAARHPDLAAGLSDAAAFPSLY